MKLSEWKPSLKAWLNDNVVIDNWQLDVPDRPGDTACLLPPVRSLGYELTDQTEVEGRLLQDIYIVKRYSGNLFYDQLNIAGAEGYYQSLAIRLAHDALDVNEGLSKLELLDVVEPIIVRETETEDREWIIEFHWLIQATYQAEPEIGSVQPPYDLKEIILGVRRSKVGNFETNRLDINLAIDVENGVVEYLDSLD